jgi:hypothetical protein
VKKLTVAILCLGGLVPSAFAQNFSNFQNKDLTDGTRVGWVETIKQRRERGNQCRPVSLRLLIC